MPTIDLSQDEIRDLAELVELKVKQIEGHIDQVISWGGKEHYLQPLGESLDTKKALLAKLQQARGELELWKSK
jgi:hypothetical protein